MTKLAPHLGNFLRTPLSTSDLYTAPKLSHVDFSFSRSERFYKTLDIEQKAIFGQKKLALNKTNKSLA